MHHARDVANRYGTWQGRSGIAAVEQLHFRSGLGDTVSLPSLEAQDINA